MKILGHLRQTTILTIGLLLFLVGLVVVRVFSLQIALAFTVVVFISSLVLFKKHKNKRLITILFTLMLAFGIIRGNSFVNKLNIIKNLFGKVVVLEVTAKEDAVYSERRMLTFSAGNARLLNGKKEDLIGNIKIEGRGLPMIYKGDRLQVSGKIYPRRGDNIAGISYAQISLISSNSSKLDSLRRHFAVGLQNILPEPLASFGLGILIGQQNTLPDELTESLRKVGLIHIVAVSGYNLTVIVYFSQRLLQKKSRFQALILSNLLILTFLLITGFSPSIVRASVVSVISLFVWYFGRKVRPMLILLLSAVITAGWNPLYIWSSVGWYLSFFAFFGILILAPLLNSRFMPPKLQNSLLPQVFTETVSAQICTLPILLYIFAGVSVLSIPANLLVVPFTPFVMLATLIAGVYGVLWPFLFGGLLVLPAKIMLSYIVELAKLLSSSSFAMLNISVNAFQAGMMTVFIILITLVLNKQVKQKLTSSVLSNTVKT